MVMCLEHPIHMVPNEAQIFSCSEPTYMAEQFSITWLSVLQAWHYLCWLWMLFPTYMSKLGLCCSSSPTIFSAIVIQHAPECQDA